MMRLLQLIGLLLLLLALGALAWDLFGFFDTGSFTLSVWGDLWYMLHPGSLNLYQAVVERYISVALWDETLAPLLLLPAVIVFGLPGLLLTGVPALLMSAKRHRDDD